MNMEEIKQMAELEERAEKAEAEIWRLENTIKSKNPKKWEFKTWVDRCTKAEARIKAQDIVIAEYKADDHERVKELEKELENANRKFMQQTILD